MKKHFSTICKYGFPGIDASCIRIKVNVPNIALKPDKEGYVDMEQIIYHVLRCGLVHECNIERTIQFTENSIIGDWNEKFYIPKDIIWGLKRISWVDEVDLMYNIRDGASVIIESTFEDMDYDYVIEKMAKAKYINFCAFDRGTYCKYEDVAVDRLASLIRNLPEDYFSKVKVCYIGMNNSERLAWALREQGVKCVIFQKRESNVQEKKDMVRFFNNYSV